MMEHPVNGPAPLIWHDPLSATPVLFCPVLLSVKEKLLPISFVTIYFCFPLPILLGTLKSERSALNWNGTLPLHRPPPKLPGHEVAVSTSKMSAFAGGANIAVAKIAVAPTIMNLGLLIDGISIIQYDELTPPPK